jgi:alkylhydroperoxidase family enzyme
MAPKPRIPESLVPGFSMMSEGGDSPAERIAIPTELSRLAAIPIRSKGSFEIDPVVHECVRLFNANYNGCTYCQNARQAVAVQAGLNEDMVSKIVNFEQSDLPDHVKAALRIANAIQSGPQTLTQQVWNVARRYYSEQETVDLVLHAMHGCGSKVAVTLGLEPGPEASSRLFFPSEGVYGSSPELKRAVQELERQGVVVKDTGSVDYEVNVRVYKRKPDEQERKTGGPTK